jgi:hypothetical protein
LAEEEESTLGWKWFEIDEDPTAGSEDLMGVVDDVPLGVSTHSEGVIMGPEWAVISVITVSPFASLRARESAR